MNAKIAKKLRQLTRRLGRNMANHDMELYQSMPLRARLRIAYRIVFKC